MLNVGGEVILLHYIGSFSTQRDDDGKGCEVTLPPCQENGYALCLLCHTPGQAGRFELQDDCVVGMEGTPIKFGCRIVACLVCLLNRSYHAHVSPSVGPWDTTWDAAGHRVDH